MPSDFKSPKSEIARTVFQTYSKKYDEGKIQLRKGVTVHYHWTFHSNIGQMSVTVRVTLEFGRCRFGRVWKYAHCILQLAYLKNGMKRVRNFVPLSWLGLFVSALDWWLVLTLNHTDSEACLSSTAWVSLMGLLRAVLISHAAFLCSGCSNGRRRHADNGADDQREERNSGLLGGYQANKWKTTEWSNQI